MIPIRDNLTSRSTPIISWTLVVLNAVLYFWDRLGGWFGPGLVFADLQMRPVEVLAGLQGGDRFALVTVFTSMFLHGTLWHLIGNLIFLTAFGQAVEAALGPVRYTLYYLFWGICAAAAHILMGPTSDVPTLGASGAIGGVLGCYFLLFPGSQVQFVVPPVFFFTFVVRAWVLLGFWFLWQILFPQEGVANWAHAGGFLAGMVTVLILGGRERVLRGRPTTEDDDFDA